MAMLILLTSYISISVFMSNALIFVSKCPLTESLWKKHFESHSCIHGTFYHCLRTTNNMFVETCGSLHGLKAEKGCPFAEVRDSQISIVQVKCPEEINGCPKKEDGIVKSNSFYRYTSCILYTYGELLNGTDLTRTMEIPRTTTHVCASMGHNIPLKTGIITGHTNVTCYSGHHSLKEKMQTTVLLLGTPVVDGDPNFLTDVEEEVIILGSVILNVVFIFIAALHIPKMKIKRNRRSLERIEISTSFRDLMDQEENVGEERIYDDVQDAIDEQEESRELNNKQTETSENKSKEYNEINENAGSSFSNSS